MAIILVVDDEVGIRELLSEILIDEGYDVRLAENAGAARRIRESLRPDLVLLDIWMPDMDGISLLKEWHANALLTMPVVMMSGHGTIDTAVEATRFGAIDFLEKPIALQKLLATVQKALRHDVPVSRPPLTLEAFSRSALIRDFRRRLEQAATKSNVLLLKGVSGGMAEICARTLQAPRTPWLDLTALPSALDQDGLQKISGGLVFVGDLSVLGKLQQMNLSFTLERLEKFNLRLVVASRVSPSALAESGWDAKLTTRLAEVWVAMPPLASHIDEIPELASLLLAHFVERSETPLRRFSSGALNTLRNLPWKQYADGGWSEFHALIRNLGLTALEEEIGNDDIARTLPEEPPAPATEPGQHPSLHALFDLPLREARDAFEKLYFEFHLVQDGGNMTQLAERAGLERTHLYRKLKQLGVNVPGKKAE